MSFQKTLLLVCTFLITSVHYGQFTDVINSNRPGESMSAFSVGLTVFQAELGVYGVQEDHEYLNYTTEGVGSELSLRYGALLEQLEFVLDLEYQSDVFKNSSTSYRRSALRQSTFGVKYLIFDPAKNYEAKPNMYSWKANHKFSWRAFIPAVALYAGVNVNMTDNEFSFPTDSKLSPKFMLMTQNQFGRYVLVINVISDKFTTDFHTKAYIVTLTRGFNERWSGFVENQGIQSDFYADAIVRGGAAWLAAENIQIDASIGTSLKTTPSMLRGGIGISWRFDKNYSDVMLRVPIEEKPGDKKKAKSSKKRKDAIDSEP